MHFRTFNMRMKKQSKVKISLKSEKIDQLLMPANKFIQHESSGGIVLFIMAVIAMIWANSPFKESYHNLWHTHFIIGFENFKVDKSLHHWINDGLMAVFFFVIGLEMKREIIGGGLSTWKQAVLPIAAGIGGMVVPALVYVLFNIKGNGMDGWGVPMATDIAFALGLLSLLGKRVPLSLKIFFTALAIADDIGAVLVIAFFYTSNISFDSLLIGAIFLALLIGGNYLGIRRTVYYGIIGIGGLWLAFLLSGVHATIAGVLAALCIPARTRLDEKGYLKTLEKLKFQFAEAQPNNNSLVTEKQQHLLHEIKAYTKYAETPLQRLEHSMHPLVAFVVMPIFALANAGIDLSAAASDQLFNPITWGVFFGLVFGKFIGIVSISKLLINKKWASLPEGATWMQMYGIALIAGIGFTMSLFVTELAFKDPILASQAKLGIILASIVAGFGLILVAKGSKINAQDK